MSGTAISPAAAGIDDAWLDTYRRAWTDRDVDAIMAKMTPDCVYEASVGPEPWGKRFEGADEVRAGIVRAFEVVFAPGGTSELVERHLFGDYGVEIWRNTSATGASVHACEFYEFRDGLIHRKLAFRKNSLDW
jgi:hypothetical protein